jgi:hypothetical protein
MLNKKGGVSLEIKPTSEGAWVSAKGVNVSFTIRPLSQLFYVSAEGRSSNLIYFWDYKTLIKAIVQPMGVNYNQLSVESVKAIVGLHDKLIASHIPAFVQIVLRSQVRAGLRQYAPLNAEVAALIPVHLIRDIQNYKLAAAILHLIIKFQTDVAGLVFNSYEELILSQAEKWMTLLSDTGEQYRALNKTIANWRGAVPKNLGKLKSLHLIKPIGSLQARMLLALLTSRIDEESKTAFAALIQNSAPSDISMILKFPQLGGANARRGGESVEEAFFNYVADSERLENASYAKMKSLIGVWNRAYRIHEEDRQRRAAQQRISDEHARKGKEEWMKTKAKPLPFPLPEEKEGKKDGGTLRFLDTVQAIHDESTLMDHCIHSYSRSAVMGDCFLFHVEYQGEMASAEVLSNGRVNQIRGPHNHRNEACTYAERKLSEWVKSWRKVLITE